MTQAQGIELARDFAQAEFVDQGMIADLNVHWDIGEDGMRLGKQLALSHGLGRGRGIGLQGAEPSYFPPFLRHTTTTPK